MLGMLGWVKKDCDNFFLTLYWLVFLNSRLTFFHSKTSVSCIAIFQIPKNFFFFMQLLHLLQCNPWCSCSFLRANSKHPLWFCYSALLKSFHLWYPRVGLRNHHSWHRYGTTQVKPLNNKPVLAEYTDTTEKTESKRYHSENIFLNRKWCWHGSSWRYLKIFDMNDSGKNHIRLCGGIDILRHHCFAIHECQKPSLVESPSTPVVSILWTIDTQALTWPRQC